MEFGRSIILRSEVPPPGRRIRPGREMLRVHSRSYRMISSSCSRAQARKRAKSDATHRSEIDDATWAGCNSTFWVALSPAYLSSFGACGAPHRGASSSSHPLTDKAMKSLGNFPDELSAASRDDNAYLDRPTCSSSHSIRWRPRTEEAGDGKAACRSQHARPDHPLRHVRRYLVEDTVWHLFHGRGLTVLRKKAMPGPFTGELQRAEDRHHRIHDPGVRRRPRA